MRMVHVFPDLDAAKPPVEIKEGSMTHICLTPSERIIAWRLTEDRWVSRLEFLNALYGNRFDGGPLCASKTMHVFITRLRKKLYEFQIVIHSWPSKGWMVKSHQIDDLLDVLANEINRNSWCANDNIL